MLLISGEIYLFQLNFSANVNLPVVLKVLQPVNETQSGVLTRRRRTTETEIRSTQIVRRFCFSNLCPSEG